ncbi:MAG TPA: PaaI family thioesterase [Gemmatimonadaceae bacterium]|jgi:uncharacterized protein (TIGR00369 family)|nr:PaaI family thioesterase [Gemmatimonadaceae bacterium]
MTHEPRDPAYESRVRASFVKQRFMQTLGAELVSVRPGEVTIGFAFREDLTQQHGFVHAGAVTAVVDSACGYAALTLMEPGTGVLAVEFKVNLLAPAVGKRFEAVGRVVRSGRTITVCAGELRTGDGTVVCVMQGTMMTVRGREGVED